MEDKGGKLAGEVVPLVADEEEDPKEAEIIDEDPTPLDEDLYGVAITSVIRDLHKISTNSARPCLRITRAATTVTLLLCNMAVQVFLISEFKRLVTRSFVHNVRHAYSDFEEWMYDSHTTLTRNGFHRGIVGHFDPDRFLDLPDHVDKSFICSIPLSQPYFFAVILAIWSLTVVQDVRLVQFHATLLCLHSKTVPTMEEVLHWPDPESTTCELVGLTLPLKICLFSFIFLPRILVDLFLLWLGCRWLMATGDFADVLLNAIALEFILCLKDLVYNAVVPMRDRYETSTLLIKRHEPSRASWGHYMGAFIWLIVVILWVVLYMTVFQRVLPDYRWDIHGVCETYIDEATSLRAAG